MTDLKLICEAVLLGTAVGDAIGLPREGLSARRAERIFGGRPLRHRLVWGRGMISDDTEHACMTAQALIASHGEPIAFARSLAWRLRGWFIALPAGVGMATAKACLRLWLGWPPRRSGVWSAGNGPAMRAPIIGAMFWDDVERMKALVAASTRLTHTDPKAEQGARAVALAAALTVRLHTEGRDVTPNAYRQFAHAHLDDDELLALIDAACTAAEQPLASDMFFQSHGMERGVSGYIYRTVPACLYCWLSSPRHMRAAVETVILPGGDADSTGAITGALAALSAGTESIPAYWLDGLTDFPRSVNWMRRLADRAAATRGENGASVRPLPMAWPLVPVRNLLFLIVVVLHGLRRLLPPY